MDMPSYLLGKKAGGGGGSASLQNKSVTVTTNGIQDITADIEYDGLKRVTLTTNVEPDLQTKNVTISSNGTQTVISDIGYDGLDEVNITTNVVPNNQTKSLTITENTTTTITPDSNYDGLSSVEITTNVSGGGDISDYFTNSILGGSSSAYYAGWVETVKKLPAFTLPSDSYSTMGYMFYNFKGEEIDLSKLNTSNITNFSYAFSSMSNLKKLDLTNIDFRNATNMQGCFSATGQSVSNFEIIFGENFNTSNVTNMSNIFSVFGGVNSVTDLSQVSGFKTDNVTNLTNAFQISKGTFILPKNLNLEKVSNMSSCFAYSNFTEIDMSTWSNTPVLTNASSMFYNDRNLTKIDMRNFDLSNVTSYNQMFGSTVSTGVPNDCLIIVKDQTQKDWILNKFSRLTNVQTVAEYEAN